jgi:succinylornithine transaminase family protein
MMQHTRADFDRYLVPNYAPADFLPVSGQGSRVTDQTGKEYIDLTSGVAVTALGHAHPELIAALTEQASKAWHFSNYYTNEAVLKLAKQLVAASFAERVFFCNSGAEANEAAFKLARKIAFDQQLPEKHELVSCTQSFHGRTLFTVSVGGQPKYTQGFAPVPDGLHHVTFNDIAALKAAVNQNTCAVVIEPIQGEGGVTPATTAYLQAARALCDEFNAVLIFDEVQTGVGRSGQFYAYQHYGVTPDILTSAKGLGGGFPIGAMLTLEKYARYFNVGTHGTTYGGNPLACAVASKVVELVNTPDVLSGVTTRGEQLKQGLAAINAKYAVFKEIRGVGLLIGAELADAYKNKANDFSLAAQHEGLMILVAGPNVLRFAPSLIIPEADLALGLELLEQAIAKLVTN